MVRLQPEMLVALDRLAQETDTTRPQALRFAFDQWAEANGFASPRPKLRERQIMIDLWQKEIDAIKAEFGDKFEDTQDAISHIVRDWLIGHGLLKLDD